MYAAIGRFALSNNAEFELSLKPAPGTSFPSAPALPQPTAVYVSFANVREHTFEAGIAPALTRGPAIQTFSSSNQLTGEGPAMVGNAYLATTVNLLWIPHPLTFIHKDLLPALHKALCFIPPDISLIPEHPSWQRSSLAVIAGTNVLQGPVGSEFVLGGAMGHVFGDAGLVVARDRIVEPEVSDGRLISPRRWRWLWGVDLIF